MTENNAGDKKLEQRVPAEIVAKIEQEVPDLKSAPRELRGKIVEGVIKVTQELYEGPIPHPSIAAAWNDLVPDAAERMLRMAEKDQDATI